MAQFMDGLRAVWEPPHVAFAEIDPARVELVATTPNAHLPPAGSARLLQEGIVADVQDGCRPAGTTILSDNVPYEEFRDALANARIEPRTERCGVLCRFGRQDPITMSRGDDGEHK